MYSIENKMNSAVKSKSNNIEIRIILINNKRSTKIISKNGEMKECSVFEDQEGIDGKVNVILNEFNKPVNHRGIEVEFFGLLLFDVKKETKFFSMKQVVEPPGSISHRNSSFRFGFVKFDKPLETYIGKNVQARYFIRVTIKDWLLNVVEEKEIVIHRSSPPRDSFCSLMEMGIKDFLHVKIRYNKLIYHMNDSIRGTIEFLKVHLVIDKVCIVISRKETIGNDSETSIRGTAEIMDGSPTKGETVPFRIFLNTFHLSPTMGDGKFSVTYFLKWVFIDNNQFHFSHTEEITIYRRYSPLVDLGKSIPSTVMDPSHALTTLSQTVVENCDSFSLSLMTADPIFVNDSFNEDQSRQSQLEVFVPCRRCEPSEQVEIQFDSSSDDPKEPKEPKVIFKSKLFSELLHK